MQQHINFDLLVSLSESGFSLDELIFKLGEIFQDKGFGGIVCLILNLVDEALCLRLMRKDRALLGDVFKPCCEGCHWELKDRDERTLRTSICRLEFKWRRLRCTRCGRSFVPLREWVGLDKWQRKTTTLEKMVVEVVSEQSCRRSSSHLERIGGIPVPRSTAHRWVAESQCDQMDKPLEPLQTMFVDGTGYKRRPDPALGKNNRGEVRVAMGLTKTGQAVPLGSWSGRSWEEIGLDLKSFQNRDQPLSEFLVSDEESGLAEGLAGLFNRAQGCHWHVVRDLGQQLWKEDASLGQRKKLKSELAAILALEIPEGEVEPVDPAEKADWKARIKKAEDELEDLAKRLSQRNWQRAADHLWRLKTRLFRYLEFWLETGLVVPRTNSFMERLMRELGRRIKKIGFGWSEEGASRMCRILLRRISDPAEWERWWEQKLAIVGNVIFLLRNVKAVTPSAAFVTP
jgi:transposase-like protein